MTSFPDTTSISAWADLFRAYKLLLEQAEKDLKKAKLPPLSWYDVLYEVHQAPQRRIRQFELGSRVLLPKYNLSRLLDRLQREELIERQPCEEDKRGSMVTLTSKGRALLKRMWRVYGATIEDYFQSQINHAESESLSSMLKKLIHQFD